MAKEVTPVKKVRATVVRGSFWRIDEDGNRVEVKPGAGKDSEVEVTETQLTAFIGTLVKVEDAAAEIEKVATESMQKVTPTDEAIATGQHPARRSR